MPNKFSLSDRVFLPMRAIHPALWLALGVLLLALAGGRLMSRQVEESRLLQDRLTGTALIDALRAYAAASTDGRPPRPLRLEELSHDQRDGESREWLDAASLEALGEPGRWRLVRDAEGRLKGARSEVRPDLVFNLDDAAAVSVPPAPAKVAAQASSFPQPVLPDMPITLPPVEPARTVRESAPRVAASGSVPPDAPATLKPSTSISSLDALQVLRLSTAHSDEAARITPRKPRVHVVRIVAAPPSAAAPKTAGRAAAARPLVVPTGTTPATTPTPVTPVVLLPASPLLTAPAPELRPAAGTTPLSASTLPSGAPAIQESPADTVISEVNQGIATHPAKGDCRGLAGDSAECDAFELNDPELYQRCYQSLSERINACVAGETVPPLINRRE